MNLIIRACGGMLAGLSWKPKLLPYCILIGFELAAIAGLLLVDDLIATRFGTQFINQLPIHSDSPYMRVWHWWNCCLSRKSNNWHRPRCLPKNLLGVNRRLQQY